MTKSRAEELARVFVKKHVVYADNDARLDMFFERYEQEQEFYPIAETCDGCDKDTIAVYQSFLAGMKAMLDEAENLIAEHVVDFGGSRSYTVDWMLKDLKKLMEQDG